MGVVDSHSFFLFNTGLFFGSVLECTLYLMDNITPRAKSSSNTFQPSPSKKEFAKEPSSCSLFHFNRWLTLLSGICLCAIAGTPVLFSVFLPYLQKSFNLTQDQVDGIATAANLGMSITLPIGFFFDRLGPRPTIILAGSLLFMGYFGIWMSLHKIISSNYILVSFFSTLIGLGSGAAYTASVPPNIHNFPKFSGRVVGALASAFGLSAAIFTQIYNLAFEPDIPKFLLFLSATLGGVCLLGSIFTNYIPKKQRHESEPLIFEDVEPHYNPLQMLATLNFYLFFFLFMVSAGAQFNIVNNIGSLLLALGGKQGDQNRFVIILSVCNFFGNICSGFFSDLARKKLNRPAFMTLSAAILGIANLYMGFSNVDMLYAGVALSGIGMGFLWAMAPTITDEIWGTTHWGFNWAIANLGVALGSYLFATLLASQIYEHYTPHLQKQCFGQECYRLTFFTIAGCCALATSAGILLSVRTKELYRRNNFRKETLDRLVN